MAFTPRTETYGDTSGATSLVCNVPAGTTDGDILFMWVGLRNISSYVINSGVSDWILLGSYVDNSDKYYLYYRIANSEPGSYTVGFSGSTKARIVMSCYLSGDFDPDDPIDVVSNTPYRTSNLIVESAEMNVANANSPMVFWAALYYSIASRTFTKPADIGSDAWIEDDDAGNSGSDFYVEVCSMIRTVSGLTGNMDATISGSTNMTTKHGFAVTLNPSSSFFQKSVSDLGAGAETLGVKNPLTLSDQGVGVDQVAMKDPITISDEGSGIELWMLDRGFEKITKSILVQKSVQDSGAGADLVSIILKILIEDSGISSEVLNILSKISVLENGAGNDIISAIKGILFLTDSGVGNDISSFKNIVAILESGNGVDEFSFLAKLLVQDSGAGIDAISWRRLISIIENGAGTDIIAQILAKVLIQELGIGLDRIKVPSVYAEKFLKQNDVYSGKFSQQDDSYANKYPKQNTQHQDKFF